MANSTQSGIHTSTKMIDRYIWWAVAFVLGFGVLCGLVGFLAGMLLERSLLI